MRDNQLFLVAFTWCALFLASYATNPLESDSNAISLPFPLASKAAERTASLEYAQVLELWHGRTIRDLRSEYGNIFRRGNRNAASHLWSAFLLQRSKQMTPEELETLFTGFCAVSGSPVSPGPHTRYKMLLDRVNGTEVTGFTYYCCWPCVCDTQDFIRVDTLTVPTAQGPKQYQFLVIGDPCLDPQASIPYQAPEVTCDKATGTLDGAVYSDHGFVILTMFYPFDADQTHQTDDDYAHHCQRRAELGYNSGMGEIFREVAGISKIVTRGVSGEICPAAISFASSGEPSTRRSCPQSGNTESDTKLLSS